ncbi:MAG TPA: hypothetical protein DF712_04460 [Balneola sp.]|nr:hypothetical protein [Balneola sp.]|tara:strand:+ start:1453 stop:1923 length:471 start_codon:yes stop_codon:yes gene_type:complete
MEILIASAAAVVVGLATGQFVTIGLKGESKDEELARRVQTIEKVIPGLIPRTEVQEVINKVPPLVAQQVQSEITELATRLQAAQPPAPVPAQPVMPPMPPAFVELQQQNAARQKALDDLEGQMDSFTKQMNMDLPQVNQMEALQKQMKPRNRKPRQ